MRISEMRQIRKLVVFQEAPIDLDLADFTRLIA
jgi:hypothetical protein